MGMSNHPRKTEWSRNERSKFGFTRRMKAPMLEPTRADRCEPTPAVTRSESAVAAQPFLTSTIG